MTVEGSAARQISLGVALVSFAAGCAEPQSIELVAVRGCGLDQAFSGLRVRLLGDSPASGHSEVLIGPGERGSIPELPEWATGVAAEGLFGTTVTAIGRSHGIDPGLARGRISGLDAAASILPVFFAPPDSLCELDAAMAPRTNTLGAAGPAGDVLLVGGLGADGELLDELVHLDLFSGHARVLDARLPSPRRGASVHAVGPRRFVILGGAAPGTVHAERLEVEVSGQGSLASAGPLELDGEALAIADHGWARSSLDGRVLVVGGCEQVDASGACVAASARGRSVWVDLREPANSEAAADLETPRFGAQVSFTTDGVTFVAGGFGADGLGLPSVERLVPGGTWETVHSLAGDAAIAGLTVLEGGLVVLSERSGALHWWSEAGSGSLDPTSRAPPLAPVPLTAERPLLTLPGERVLVGSWLFAPATAAVDPAAERVALAPLDRSESSAIALADGTVLIAGGRDPNGLAAATLLRLRPALDGPDEWIPNLAGPQTDAFVSNAPGQVTVVVGGLRIDANGGAPIHAHVRGFRSRAFRLEFEFDHDPEASARLVLSQGAATLVSVDLLPGQLVVRRRDASGVIEQLDCAGAGVEPGATVIVEVQQVGQGGAGGQLLRLTSAGELLAACELAWPATAGVAVGFGASGTGAARFFRLRLARR